MLKGTVKYEIIHMVGEAMHDYISDLAKGTCLGYLGPLLIQT